MDPLTGLPIRPRADWVSGLARPSPKLYRLSVSGPDVWSPLAQTSVCPALIPISLRAFVCASICRSSRARSHFAAKNSSVKRKQTTAKKKKKGKKMQFVLCMRDKLLIFNWFKKNKKKISRRVRRRILVCSRRVLSTVGLGHLMRLLFLSSIIQQKGPGFSISALPLLPPPRPPQRCGGHRVLL